MSSWEHLDVYLDGAGHMSLAEPSKCHTAHFTSALAHVSLMPGVCQFPPARGFSFQFQVPLVGSMGKPALSALPLSALIFITLCKAVCLYNIGCFTGLYIAPPETSTCTLSLCLFFFFHYPIGNFCIFSIVAGKVGETTVK